MPSVKDRIPEPKNIDRGKRLRAAREALGHTIPDKEGRLFGASRQSVYNYEGEKSPPSAEYLEGLCNAGVSADYLLRGVGPVLRGDEGGARDALVRIRDHANQVLGTGEITRDKYPASPEPKD